MAVPGCDERPSQEASLHGEFDGRPGNWLGNPAREPGSGTRLGRNPAREEPGSGTQLGRNPAREEPGSGTQLGNPAREPSPNSTPDRVASHPAQVSEDGLVTWSARATPVRLTTPHIRASLKATHSSNPSLTCFRETGLALPAGIKGEHGNKALLYLGTHGNLTEGQICSTFAQRLQHTR